MKYRFFGHIGKNVYDKTLIFYIVDSFHNNIIFYSEKFNCIVFTGY